MLKYLIYISFLVIFVRLNAQDTIKVDSTLSDTNKITKKFNVSTRGNFNRGNVNRDIFSINSAYSISEFNKDLDISVAYLYGTQDKSLKQEEIDFNLSLKLLKSKPTYIIAFSELHKSYARKIEYQHSIGLGLGKYLIKKDSSKLSMSLAIINELADYKTYKDVHVHRMSLRISGKHYIKNTYVKYLLWFQPAIEYSTNRTNFSIEYNVPLNKSIMLSTVYQIDYDDLILEEGVNALDSSLLFGLKFNINKNKWT